MKKIFWLIPLLSFMFAGLAFANINMVTKNYTGSGNSLNNAVQDALVNAVSDTSPTVVKSIKSSHSGWHDKGGLFDDSSSEYGHWDTSRIKAITNGIIQKYTIVKQEHKNNIWTVTVKVTLAKYKAIMPTKRYTFAISPFEVNPGAVDANVYLSQSGILISQTIVNRFSEDGKFTIVARKTTDAKKYKAEMALLKSDQVSPEQKARLGQMIGSDFFLVGDVSNFTFKKVKRDYYGASFDKWIVKLTINYRVLEVATMEVKLANSVTVMIPGKKVNHILENDGDIAQIEQSLFNMAADKIAKQVENKLIVS